jgi:hypothetical protein
MTKHLVPASHHQTQKLRAEANAVFPELCFVKEYSTLPDPSPTSGRLGRALIKWLPRNLTFPVSQRQEDVFGWASGRPARAVSVPVRIIASTLLAVRWRSAYCTDGYYELQYESDEEYRYNLVLCSALRIFLGAIVRSKSSEIFIATATYAAVPVGISSPNVN